MCCFLFRVGGVSWCLKVSDGAHLMTDRSLPLRAFLFCGKRKNKSLYNYSSAERSHYSLPNSSSRLRFLPPFIPRNQPTLISPLSLSPSPVGGNQPQRTGNRSNPLVHPTRRDKRRKCLLTRGAVESVSHLYLSVVGRVRTVDWQEQPSRAAQRHKQTN